MLSGYEDGGADFLRPHKEQIVLGSLSERFGSHLGKDTLGSEVFECLADVLDALWRDCTFAHILDEVRQGHDAVLERRPSGTHVDGRGRLSQ